MHQPLEELKQLLADRKLHLEIGTIQQLEVSPVRKTVRALVALQPDDHQIVAKVTWDNIDDEAGVIMLPAIGDLVTVGFVSGDEDNAWVLSSASSVEERIPKDALDGSLVIKARKGKPLRLLSDLKVLIQKAKFGADPSDDADQPLVLGNVLKDFDTQLWDTIKNAPQLGLCAVGPVFLDPALQAQIEVLIQKFVVTAATNYLSQIGFTERGN